MKTNDKRGILLSDLKSYTNNVPLYNTTYFVTYYDISNNQTVTTKKINERWGFNTSIDQLGLDVPKGYSDQIFDYNKLNNETASFGILGVQSIKAKHNQIFIQYNVTPKLGRIDVIYVGQLENIISSNTYYSPINSSFNEDKFLPSNNDLVVKVLYPKDGIATFTSQDQVLVVQSYIRPVGSTINIKYITTDNQVVNGISKITSPSGTRFDINNTTKNVPDGYEYVNCYNPDDITVFPRDPNSPNTIYFLVKPTKNNADKIRIIFIDQHNKKVGSYEIFGNPYTKCNIISNLTLPDDCSLAHLDVNTVEFLPQEQNIYVGVYSAKPTENKSVPSPITPTDTSSNRAYVTFIDEDNDPSLNPVTYPKGQSLHEQNDPQPQDNPQIIYMNNNPSQFNDVNNINLNQIYYQGNPVTADTLITGPNIYWKSYQYDLQYPNMYEYAIDTSKSPQFTKLDGIPLVVIYCYPAFVKGVTFQLVALAHDNIPYGDHFDAPQDDTRYLPKGWSFNVDPVTHNTTYTVPYMGTTSVYYYLHVLMGGANGKFTDKSGKLWVAPYDRKITFTQPYAYMIQANPT